MKSHCKKYLAGFLLLFIGEAGNAQLPVIRGFVTEANSRTEHGKTKFLPFVRVVDRGKDANMCVTGANGKFELAFNHIQVGSTVYLTAERQDYKVVNSDKLEAIVGQKKDIGLTMIKEEDWLEASTAYFQSLLGLYNGKKGRKNDDQQPLRGGVRWHHRRYPGQAAPT
jgi:hypothetical protein